MKRNKHWRGESFARLDEIWHASSVGTRVWKHFCLKKPCTGPLWKNVLTGISRRRCPGIPPRRAPPPCLCAILSEPRAELRRCRGRRPLLRFTPVDPLRSFSSSMVSAALRKGLSANPHSTTNAAIPRRSANRSTACCPLTLPLLTSSSPGR